MKILLYISFILYSASFLRDTLDEIQTTGLFRLIQRAGCDTQPWKFESWSSQFSCI